MFKRPGARSSRGLTHPGCERQREARAQWHQLTGQQLVGVPVSRRQRGVRVVPGFVVIVFHVKAGHL